RKLVVGSITCDLSAGVFPKEKTIGLASAANARLSSYAIRSTSPKIQLREGYVCRMPYPSITDPSIQNIESSCVAIKSWLVSLDHTERTFELSRTCTNLADAALALLHSIEGISERAIFGAYDVVGDASDAVIGETGSPAGWFPLIAGYDAV